MSRWPNNETYFWETAPFFRILAPFALGITCYYNPWSFQLPVALFSVIALASTVLYVVLLALNHTKGSFWLAHIALLTLGTSIAGYNDIRSRHNWFGHHVEPSKTYMAYISGYPQEKPTSWKLPVRIVSSIDEGRIQAAPGNAFVYLKKSDIPMMLHKGDTLLLPGKWEQIKDAGNPFEFSYAAYCAHNNILHHQYCTQAEVRLYAPTRPDAAPATERMHDWSMRQLNRYLGNHKAKGLLQSMLIGDEINLDQDLRQSFADTGLVHIIAISGGNVAVFFIVISTLLGWLKHKRYTWIKYAVAMPIVWFYVLAAGAQPSAVRAAAMFSLLSFGIIIRRDANSLNELFATAFVLLCAEPAWLLSIGFQLSFAAVLSIVVFYKYVFAWIPVKRREGVGTGFVRFVTKRAFDLPFKLWRVIAMSIAAEVLIAPLVIYYFHSFPIMFIAANVAAYLFMSFVLMQGMVMLALSNIPFAAATVAAVIQKLTDFFSALVGSMQDVGPWSFRHISLSTLETIVLYSAVADMAWFLLRRYKPALFASVGALCILMVSLCVTEWKTLNQHRLVVYNTSHACHAEVEEGMRYHVMCTDSAAAPEIAYATRPAHTGWNVSEEQPAADKEICYIDGKSLLILNRQPPVAGRFPVDYLLLNDSANTDVRKLREVFSPSMIVVSNRFSKSQLARIHTECKQCGIAVHTLAEQGAFVLAKK